MVHIPLKSDNDIVIELSENRIDFAILTPQFAVPFAQQGKQRILAVTSVERMPFLPGLPSLKEVGIPELTSLDPYTFYGLVALAGTPPEVVRVINDNVNEIVRTPEVADQMRNTFRIEPRPQSPEAYRAFLQAELAKWRETGSRLNINSGDVVVRSPVPAARAGSPLGSAGAAGRRAGERNQGAGAADGGESEDGGSAAATFEPVRPARAFEEITAQLRRRVIHGQLEPGDKLPPERDLAVKLGVSRNSVREALRVLETAGVLRLQKGAHGGAIVASPSGEGVAVALQDMFQLGSVTPAQLTEARLHITDTVVRLACARITPGQIDALEVNVEQSRAASDAGDYVTRSRIDLEFHKLLARATGNPVFESVMAGPIAVMQHFVDTLGPPRVDQVCESRSRFIARLRAGQPQAAIDEMSAFLRDVHSQYLSRLEARPEAEPELPTKARPTVRRRRTAKPAR